jgi:hypothetical protein
MQTSTTEAASDEHSVFKQKIRFVESRTKVPKKSDKNAKVVITVMGGRLPKGKGGDWSSIVSVEFKGTIYHGPTNTKPAKGIQSWNDGKDMWIFESDDASRIAVTDDWDTIEFN